MEEFWKTINLIMKVGIPYYLQNEKIFKDPECKICLVDLNKLGVPVTIKDFYEKGFDVVVNISK